MNTITPRTDKAVQESNGQWSFAMRNLCIEMECELTKVITERDELVAKYRMHHDEAERITREIAEVRKQRDTLAEALRKCVLWAECMSMRCERDRDNISWSYLNDAREALATVKGGEA
jgi:uncharacterized coiled-coil DUF342 family protein